MQLQEIIIWVLKIVYIYHQIIVRVVFLRTSLYVPVTLPSYAAALNKATCISQRTNAQLDNLR